MIHLELEFTATYCNSWPQVEIYGNKVLIWQGNINQQQHIEFFFSNPSVEVEIKGIGKSRGENQTWDTLLDDTGKIVQDKTLTLSRVKINSVDMTQNWIDRLPNIHYGTWYDNFDTNFCIETPVLDWIIRSKFFEANQDKSKKFIFNNYNKKWDYSMLQQKINDLRERLKHA